MFKHIIGFFFMFVILLGYGYESKAFETYEHGAQFVRIEVKFQSKNRGLIWGYECEQCEPRRLMFDKRLTVETGKKITDVKSLKELDGKPVLVNWIPNTRLVIRVLPWEY